MMGDGGLKGAPNTSDTHHSIIRLNLLRFRCTNQKHAVHCLSVRRTGGKGDLANVVEGQID